MNTEQRLHLPRVLAAVAVCLFVLVCAATLDISVPFTGYGLSSAFCFHMCLQPRWRELLKVIAVSPVIFAVYVFLTVSRFRLLDVPAIFGILGLASFVIVGVRWSLQPQERKQMLRVLVPSAIMVIFLLGLQKLPGLASLLYPKTLDLYALVSDASLGAQPSFALAQFTTHTGLHWLEALTYNAIPLPIIFAYAVHIRRRQAPVWEVIELFFAAGLIGYLLYLVFPVTGPRWAFPDYFPDHPLAANALRRLRMEWIPVSQFAARNGIPSLHMAWALLAWWATRGLSKPLQAVALLFAVITAWDTVATGEHYVVDLVVAYPFSLVILAIAMRRLSWHAPLRYGPALAGTAVYGGWLVLIRFGYPFLLKSPMIPWALMVATVVTTEIVRRRMPALVGDEQQSVEKRTGERVAAAFPVE